MHGILKMQTALHGYMAWDTQVFVRHAGWPGAVALVALVVLTLLYVLIAMVGNGLWCLNWEVRLRLVRPRQTRQVRRGHATRVGEAQRAVQVIVAQRVPVSAARERAGTPQYCVLATIPLWRAHRR